MLTRANIAYNLYKSPHLLEKDYNGTKVVYHFSSELYRSKFLTKVNNNRETISKSLYNRFGFNIDVDILADFKLYTTIEKRGFLLSVNGVYAECQNNITLDGQKPIIKSF